MSCGVSVVCGYGNANATSQWIKNIAGRCNSNHEEDKNRSVWRPWTVTVCQKISQCQSAVAVTHYSQIHSWIIIQLSFLCFLWFFLLQGWKCWFLKMVTNMDLVICNIAIRINLAYKIWVWLIHTYNKLWYN